MRRKILKITVLVFTSLFLSFSEAHAIIKLDFFEPIADVLKFVEKTLSKYENIYNEQLEKLNQKLTSAFGQEGMKIFREFVVKPGTIFFNSVASGQFNANGSAGSSFVNSLGNLIGKEQLEYAFLDKSLRDMVDSKEKEKQDKLLEIEEYLVRLQSERSALNDQLQDPALQTEDNLKALDEYDQKIASLQAEFELVKAKKVLEDPEVKGQIDKKKEKQKTILEKTDKYSLTSMQKELDNFKIEEIFGTSIDQEATEDLYQTGVEKLFLKENEVMSPENINRIMQARHEEFYEAEKNLLKVIVNTNKSIDKTKEYMEKCQEMSSEAEGRFGTASMRVCIDLQSAKAAAQYMEMLLAELRFETAQEIQSWNDKYKMRDYSHDMTSLNLDDYVLSDNEKKGNQNKDNGSPWSDRGKQFDLFGLKF